MVLPPFLWRVTVCQSSVVMSVTRVGVVVVGVVSDASGVCLSVRVVGMVMSVTKVVVVLLFSGASGVCLSVAFEEFCSGWLRVASSE